MGCLMHVPMSLRGGTSASDAWVDIVKGRIDLESLALDVLKI